MKKAGFARSWPRLATFALAFVLMLNMFAICVPTMARAEEVPVSASDSDVQEPIEEGSSYGSTYFYYTGTANSIGNLWFYVKYAVSTDTTETEGLLSTFGITSSTTTYNGYDAVKLTGDKSKLSSVWISFGFGSTIANVPVSFNGGAIEVEDAAVYGSNTFVYVGEEEGKTASDLRFYVTYAVSQSKPETTAGELATFGISTSSGTSGEYSSVTLRGNISDLSGVWVSVGLSDTIGSTALGLDGTVYYVSDTGISTTPPSVPKNDYSFTVYCYGDGYQIGAWMALVEGGAETAWSPSAESVNRSFSGYDGQWSSVSISWSYPDVYNRLAFNIGQASPWESSTYNFNFTGLGGSAWVIPGDGSVYYSLAEAEEAINNAVTSTTLVVHYKRSDSMSGWKVGTWFTSAVDGGWGSKDTNFTYKDGWGYVAVVKYDVKVSELGFMVHRDVVIDGLTKNWYRSDTAASGTVAINKGFAEVWVVSEGDGMKTECPADAEIFDPENATTCKIYNYGVWNTSGGIDATVVFHYYRADQKYGGWSIGAWAARVSGFYDEGVVEFTSLDSGMAIGELSLAEWPTNRLEFVPFRDNWNEMDGGTKYLYKADILENLDADGKVHIYIYEGSDEVYFEPQPDLMGTASSGSVSRSIAKLMNFFGVGADSEGGSGVWIILLGVVVLAAAAGTAVYFIRKRAAGKAD